MGIKLVLKELLIVMILIGIEIRVVKIVGPIIEIKVKKEKCKMSKYDTFSIIKKNAMMMFGYNKTLNKKNSEKIALIYNQIKTKKGMVIMNLLKNYKNNICSEIHEMNNLGFLKNLCLRDSSFLRINEKGIFNEKKIVSPCGKKVLGRLLDVLGCELDECKEMDIFENPIFYQKKPEMGTATAAAVQRVVANGNIGEW